MSWLSDDALTRLRSAADGPVPRRDVSPVNGAGYAAGPYVFA